jgi:hypothetical protein
MTDDAETKTHVYPCRVCGHDCMRLDPDDIEALGLNDGSVSWHVVHMQCARDERKKKEQEKP